MAGNPIKITAKGGGKWGRYVASLAKNPKAGGQTVFHSGPTAAKVRELYKHGGEKLALEVTKLVYHKAQQYVPVDTGALRSSGRVIRLGKLNYIVMYGGPNNLGGKRIIGNTPIPHSNAHKKSSVPHVYYAGYVHENVQNNIKTVGKRGPRFLQRAWNDTDAGRRKLIEDFYKKTERDNKKS